MKARAKMKVRYSQEYVVTVGVRILVENCRTPQEAYQAAASAINGRLMHLDYELTAPEQRDVKKLDPRRFPE